MQNGGHGLFQGAGQRGPPRGREDGRAVGPKPGCGGRLLVDCRGPGQGRSEAELLALRLLNRAGPTVALLSPGLPPPALAQPPVPAWGMELPGTLGCRSRPASQPIQHPLCVAQQRSLFPGEGHSHVIGMAHMLPLAWLLAPRPSLCPLSSLPEERELSLAYP